MDSSLTDLTKGLEETQKWLKSWQTEKKDNAKAFLIPASDLVDMLTEIGVITKDDKSGKQIVNSVINKDIRAYIGLDPDRNNRIMKEGYGNKIFMVGTELVNGVHKDIVEGNTGVDLKNMMGTGIFDFARPCPSDCDIASPLYDPK